MTIDSGGRVLTPQRPAFYAYGDDGWTGLAAVNFYINNGDHTTNLILAIIMIQALNFLPQKVVYICLGRKFTLTTLVNPQVQIRLGQTSSGSTTTIAFTIYQQQAGDGTIGITRIYNAVAGQQIGAYVYKSVLVANTDYFLRY